MKTLLTIVMSLGVVITATSFGGPVEPAAADGNACARKSFKTTLVKEACKKGGQKEAKSAMRAFMKTAKKKSKEIKNCKSCHSSLKPDYKLKDNGLELYKKAGGK